MDVSKSYNANIQNAKIDCTEESRNNAACSGQQAFLPRVARVSAIVLRILFNYLILFNILIFIPGIEAHNFDWSVECLNPSSAGC
jgi:hypothetical protein